MSIRLRLTLTYSAILALTLIIFSTLLYFSQVRLTMNDFRGRLAGSFAIAERRLFRPPRFENEGRRPRGPFTYAQVRNLEGQLIEPDEALEGEVLPLGPKGLQAVKRGDTWVEWISLDSERFLVQSRLVTGPDGQEKIIQIAGALGDRDQYLNTLRTILIIGSTLAVLVAFGLGWVLAGLTLRPITRIRQTAQAIGAERDFSRRVNYRGPQDEVGQLATTFNNMLTELQAAFHQVEQSLKTQQHFVADASHELRTPLTTLRGNIDLLQRDPPPNAEDQLDILTDMEDESERLIRLVNNLLVLARADAERPLRRETILLKPLLEDVCHQARTLAPDREISCQIFNTMKLQGDRDALKQIFLILLDNALQHTSSPSTIAVSSQIADKNIQVTVKDNGPGIDPARLPYIFDRFYQGNTARTGTGTGLGLAIAKELVEAQGGTITATSTLGQGTTFKLTFPQID